MGRKEGGAPSHPASPAIRWLVQGNGDLAEEQVMSEVHLGCPPHRSGPHVSHFTVSIPPRCERIDDYTSSAKAEVYEVDEDGDLVLNRRRSSHKDSFVVSIQHNITSSIPNVGLQVWKAELVLADFVLHMMYKSSNFDGITAVELGAGTGLVGLLLACKANSVYITGKTEASVCVRELDWNCSWPPEVNINHPSGRSYGWTTSDVAEVQKASLLLAADVIYDDNLTDAFFSVLELIMSSSPEKVLYLALEKRYNFSIDDLDVVANGYSHFLSYIKDAQEEDEDHEPERSRRFTGRLVDLEEVPQYVERYDRGKDVELWQINYGKTTP